LIMLALVRLMIISFVPVAAWAAPSAAQSTNSTPLVVAPPELRGAEIIEDAESQSVIVRGHFDRSGSEGPANVEIVCDRRSGTLTVRNAAEHAQDLYPAVSGDCDALVAAIRERENPAQ
jgi:hypothetical protein